MSYRVHDVNKNDTNHSKSGSTEDRMGGNAVKLEPFLHQVSGQALMLRYDRRTLCKLFDANEYNFYLHAPEALEPFLPRFKGAIEVHIQEDDMGYVKLTGFPLSTDGAPNSQSTLCASRSTPQLRIRRSGGLDHENFDNIKEHFVDDHEQESNPLANPWAVRCQRNQLSKLLRDNDASPVPRKFILLEDITSKFKCPSILDLKMGTRQHGDNDSEGKRQGKIERCARSTSALLGVRVMGMQVYSETLGKYACRNKFYGRKLTGAGFRDALRQFLSDGACLRQDLIPPILDKLRQLRVAISLLDTFRFYSSSLLIIYEGANKGTSGKSGPAGNSPVKQSSRSYSDGHLAGLLDQQSPCSCTCTDCTISPELKCLGSPYQVEIRMVDFAHTRAYSGNLSAEFQHVGPDDGYIFGLENLISVLDDIFKQYSSDSSHSRFVQSQR